MDKWSVILAPCKPNGRWRRWVGLASGSDEAIETAEESNPGWYTHTYGPYVEGSETGP